MQYLFWYDIADATRESVLVFGKIGERSVGVEVTAVPHTVWFQLTSPPTDELVASLRVSLQNLATGPHNLQHCNWSVVSKHVCPHISFPLDDAHAGEYSTQHNLLQFQYLYPNPIAPPVAWTVIASKIPLIRRVFVPHFTATERFMLDKNLKRMGWVRTVGACTPPHRTTKTNCDINLLATFADVEALSKSHTDELGMIANLSICYLAFASAPEMIWTRAISAKAPKHSITSVCTMHVKWCPVSQSEHAGAELMRETFIASSTEEGFFSDHETLRRVVDRIRKADVVVGHHLHTKIIPKLIGALNYFASAPKSRSTETADADAQQDDAAPLNWTCLTKLRFDPERHCPTFDWTVWWKHQSSLRGVVFCDVFKLMDAKGIFPLRHGTYSLPSMARAFMVPEYHFNRANCPDESTRCRHSCEVMRQFCVRHDLIGVTFGISAETGTLWGHVMNLSMTDINNNNFLHEFYDKGFVFHHYNPSSAWGSRKKAGSVTKVEGGLVLPAVVGPHADVFLVDIQGSYPSIIRALNLCFSKLDAAALKYFDPDFQVHLENLQHRGHHDSDLGVIPAKCADLWFRRIRLKDELKALQKLQEPSVEVLASIRKMQIEIKTLKLIGNVVYGCLLQPSSKFCNRAMAAMVTAYGRCVLKTGSDAVEAKFPSEVDSIGGDTDSLMYKSLRPPLDALQKPAHLRNVAATICELLNTKFPGIEFAEDGIYQYFYVVQTKRYVAAPFNAQVNEHSNIVTEDRDSNEVDPDEAAENDSVNAEPDGDGTTDIGDANSKVQAVVKLAPYLTDPLQNTSRAREIVTPGASSTSSTESVSTTPADSSHALLVFKGCDPLQGGVAAGLRDVRTTLLAQLVFLAPTRKYAAVVAALKKTISGWVHDLIEERPFDHRHYVICNRMNHSVRHYASNCTVPHIQAAWQLCAIGREPVVGERVEYVMVRDPLSKNGIQAYPRCMLASSAPAATSWAIAYDWYARKHFFKELQRNFSTFLSDRELDVLLDPILL
jgi:DNA polymerase elongation subunit (family B)